MRNYLLVLLSALLCSCTPTFTIDGNISDLKSNYILYSKDFNPGIEQMDSVKVENGKFTIKGDFTGKKTISIGTSDGQFGTEVIIEEGKIPITGSSENYIVDTKENSLYHELIKLDNQLSDLPRAEFEEKYLDALIKYSKENPNSIGCLNACFTLVMFYNSGDHSVKKLKQLRANFNELADKEYCKKLDDLIEATEKREAGKMLMNYELQTIDGKKVMLHDVLGDGITVIDVWASWCSYCRKLIPQYKEAAEKYKDKNINFVFLSLDDKIELWEKAIKHDDINDFVNISSLKGRSDDMKVNYRMFGIPDNLIVGEDGRIIANHKREILQYLEDYFSKN